MPDLPLFFLYSCLESPIIRVDGTTMTKRTSKSECGLHFGSLKVSLPIFFYGNENNHKLRVVAPTKTLTTVSESILGLLIFHACKHVKYMQVETGR